MTFYDFTIMINTYKVNKVMTYRGDAEKCI
jgi:hypothetical protein